VLVDRYEYVLTSCNKLVPSSSGYPLDVMSCILVDTCVGVTCNISNETVDSYTPTKLLDVAHQKARGLVLLAWLMLVNQNCQIFSPDRTRQFTHKRGTLSLGSAECTGVPTSVPYLLGGDTKCCACDMDGSSGILTI